MSLSERVMVSLRLAEQDDKPNVKGIIKDLINTDFGGSNEEQGKAVQLMRGLAFSDDPLADKFMKAINDFTSKMDPDDFGGKGEKEEE